MTLDLAPQQVDYLMQMLLRCPLGEALPTFETIRDQLQRQQPPQGQDASPLRAVTPAA
jgi:hypothetical protein